MLIYCCTKLPQLSIHIVVTNSAIYCLIPCSLFAKYVSQMCYRRFSCTCFGDIVVNIAFNTRIIMVNLLHLCCLLFEYFIFIPEDCTLFELSFNGLYLSSQSSQMLQMVSLCLLHTDAYLKIHQKPLKTAIFHTTILCCKFILIIKSESL